MNYIIFFLIFFSSFCFDLTAHPRQVAETDRCGKQAEEVIIRDSLKEEASPFTSSDDVIVKQESTKYVPAFTYNQRLDVLYSVSFPIELVVQNRTENDARIMSMQYYYLQGFRYLRGYGDLKKMWVSNLSIYEIRGDSLVWIGEPYDILGIDPFTSKRYVVYTEHFVDKDRAFQERFKSIKESMKREDRKRSYMDYQQYTEAQIRYLKKMIAKDSIRVNIYLNDKRHRVKLPIDTAKFSRCYHTTSCLNR